MPQIDVLVRQRYAKWLLLLSVVVFRGICSIEYPFSPVLRLPSFVFVMNIYYLLWKVCFCFAVGHLSFGKGGTPDSHGLLGKEFGKTFAPVCRYCSKFVYCDYMYCSWGPFGFVLGSLCLTVLTVIFPFWPRLAGIRI